jgi:hypothetical protein
LLRPQYQAFQNYNKTNHFSAIYLRKVTGRSRFHLPDLISMAKDLSAWSHTPYHHVYGRSEALTMWYLTENIHLLVEKWTAQEFTIQRNPVAASQSPAPLPSVAATASQGVSSVSEESCSSTSPLPTDQIFWQLFSPIAPPERLDRPQDPPSNSNWNQFRDSPRTPAGILPESAFDLAPVHSNAVCSLNSATDGFLPQDPDDPPLSPLWQMFSPIAAPDILDIVPDPPPNSNWNPFADSPRAPAEISPEAPFDIHPEHSNTVSSVSSRPASFLRIEFDDSRFDFSGTMLDGL